MSNDCWRTPAELIKFIQEWKPITLDPCADSDERNHFASRNYVYPKQDGLIESWQGFTYFNPPYSAGNLIKWIAKAREQVRAGVEVMGLVPLDTTTKWWRVAVAHMGDDYVGDIPVLFCALNKRLKFQGASDVARFSSALLYYGNDRRYFVNRFRYIGEIYRRI